MRFILCPQNGNKCNLPRGDDDLFVRSLDMIQNKLCRSAFANWKMCRKTMYM